MSAPTLKELVAKCTPGPWVHAGGEIQTATGERVGNTCGRHISVEEMLYTGKFVARVNPETILAIYELLEEIQSGVAPFKRDQLEFANSVIETNQARAEKALSLLDARPSAKEGERT